MRELPIAPMFVTALLLSCGADEAGSPPPVSLACTAAPPSGAFAGDTLSYSARLDGLGGACDVRHGEQVTFTSWARVVSEGSPAPPAQPAPCTLPYDVELPTGTTTSARLVFEFDAAVGSVEARYEDGDSPANGETFVFPSSSCVVR
jgi:hypothetical protein